MKSRIGRGGYIRDIVIRNIRMQAVALPIAINMRYRCGLSDEEMSDLLVGEGDRPAELYPKVSSLIMEHIEAADAQMAAVLLGLEQAPIEDVQFNDFCCTYADAVSAGFEAIMSYTPAPEPSRGIWHRNCRNLIITNSSVV